MKLERVVAAPMRLARLAANGVGRARAPTRDRTRHVRDLDRAQGVAVGGAAHDTVVEATVGRAEGGTAATATVAAGVTTAGGTATGVDGATRATIMGAAAALTAEGTTVGVEGAAVRATPATTAAPATTGSGLDALIHTAGIEPSLATAAWHPQQSAQLMQPHARRTKLSIPCPC